MSNFPKLKIAKLGKMCSLCSLAECIRDLGKMQIMRIVAFAGVKNESKNKSNPWMNTEKCLKAIYKYRRWVNKNYLRKPAKMTDAEIEAMKFGDLKNQQREAGRMYFTK